MMFDKDLFLLLCEMYDVELSTIASRPMIKEGKEIHAITSDDVNRVFAPYQAYFSYSSNKVSAKSVKPEFYLQEDDAIAC